MFFYDEENGRGCKSKEFAFYVRAKAPKFTADGCYDIQGQSVKIKWNKNGAIAVVPLSVLEPTDYGRRVVLGQR